MRFAVFGTGMVGQVLAGKLSELGHEVTVGTRDVEATSARTEPGPLGNPPFPLWRETHPDVRLETAADAAADAELIVNATNGAGSIAMLESAGEDNLAGKVLLDIANRSTSHREGRRRSSSPTPTPSGSRSSGVFRRLGS